MSDMGKTVKLLSLIMQLGLNGKERAIPFMLQGPPGVGKTYGLIAIAAEIARRLRKPFESEVWSGPQIQAEDAAGLPVPDLKSGTTRLLPMRIGSKVLKAGCGVVAIDEFGSITNTQEAAFLNFIHGGVLGEQKLPECISRGAMMNPEDIASNGRQLSPPAANRFAWFPEWDLPVGVWCDYMRGGPGFVSHIQVLPEDWHLKVPAAKALIASYISRNSSQLLDMPAAHRAGCAWPSPRSWENAAILFAAAQAVGDRKTGDLATCAIQACVGDGSASAFVGWLTEINLPDPEEMLADPENAHKLLPDRPDQVAVALESLAAAALEERKDLTDRWNTAWKIIGPVFVARNDDGISAAKMLAKQIPTGAIFPKEAHLVKAILKKAGIISADA
jgi:hypothetical protein